MTRCCVECETDQAVGAVLRRRETGMTTCGTCGTGYGGKRTEHCMSCHETFASAEPGDSHRVGDHNLTEGPDRRRCRTSSEMIEGGMWTTVNPFGTIIWHGRVRKDRQARRDGRH